MKLHIVYRKTYKYFLLLLTLVAIMLFWGLVIYSPPSPHYEVVARFLVSQEPSAASMVEDRQRLANWQVSEYIAGGLAEWVQSDNFAQRVSAKLLSDQNVNVPFTEIRDGIKAENMRSVLKVTFNSKHRDDLLSIMNVVTKVLIEQNFEGIPQLGGDLAQVVQLDEFIVKTDVKAIRFSSYLVIAIVLGIGLSITLLANYRYRMVYLHTREDIESIGLLTLGEIPRDTLEKHLNEK
jgi:hypothetical protein